MNPKELKLIVKEKYSEIALQNPTSDQVSCGCGPGCCSDISVAFIGDDYSKLKGFPETCVPYLVTSTAVSEHVVRSTKTLSILLTMAL